MALLEPDNRTRWNREPFFRLAFHKQVMHALQPRQPDMRVETPEHGEFFAEFTMSMDDEEQSFQSTFQEFAEHVDNRFAMADGSFLD